MANVRRIKPVGKVSWRTAFEEFLLTKQAEGRAERTLKDYMNHLTSFFQEHEEAWPDYHALRLAIRKHFASLTEKSPAYYNLRRAYLKSFFNWCVKEGYLVGNPIEIIPKRRDEEKPRSVGEEIKQVLGIIDKNTYTGIRDLALILLQLDTGIRPGEALRLTPDCFNLAMLEVHVPPRLAKTRQGRTVVISPQTAKAIRKLLSVRPSTWGMDVPVFASQDGTVMRIDTWSHRLSDYGKKVGLRLTPYMLRHTSAIMSLRNGASVFFVQRQLGHSTLTMTKRYVHLVESDMHREHATCSPVAEILKKKDRVRKIKKKES